MAPASKQAKRAETKKGKAQPEDDVAPVGGQSVGNLVDYAKSLVLGSVLAEVAPKFPTLAKDGVAIVKGEKKAEKKEEKKEEKSEEEKENEPADEKEAKNGDVPDHVLGKDTAGGMFNTVCARLHWSNPLGLATPTTGEAAIKAWLAIKNQELDFGPRAKRKGNPALDRITANVYTNLPQYLHVVLALMVLRAFLFRSFFACLPWLVGYQFLSVFLPLDSLAQLPQLPLDKVPVEFRVLATVGINGLVQFFFLYELVWKAWFFEKFFVLGVVVYHAYAVRPVEV